MEGGSIDFDSFSVLDDVAQDLFNFWLYVFERVAAFWIVADDQIQMGKNAVGIVMLEDLVQVIIIFFIIFLLAFSFLKFLVPKFLVFDLMDGKKHEVEWILFEQLLIGVDRMKLDTKFKSFFDRDFILVLGNEGGELVKVARIIDVQNRIFWAVWIIGIVFNAMVYVVSDADFFEP